MPNANRTADQRAEWVLEKNGPAVYAENTPARPAPVAETFSGCSMCTDCGMTEFPCMCCYECGEVQRVRMGKGERCGNCVAAREAAEAAEMDDANPYDAYGLRGVLEAY